MNALRPSRRLSIASKDERTEAAEGKPDAFAVYKGKLYLCGNQDALKRFKVNIDDNIEKADTNWRQLTGS